jgi:hypothetical protein
MHLGKKSFLILLPGMSYFCRHAFPIPRKGRGSRMRGAEIGSKVCAAAASVSFIPTSLSQKVSLIHHILFKCHAVGQSLKTFYEHKLQSFVM